MAKKKKDETDVVEVVPGTVEYERQQFFEREKAAYEERTGEKVSYELDAPLTSTPLLEVSSEKSEDAGGSEDSESTPPEGEG